MKFIIVSFFITLFLIPPTFLHARQAEEANQHQEIYRELEVFANVLSLIQKYYVDEIVPREVINGAINGMLTSLDPHSSYLQAEDFKELQEETRGTFSGIGIEVTIRDGILTAVSPIEGTPAARQGIRAGDQIIRIDGESTKGMTLMEMVRKLRGEKGSTVTLVIHRQGEQELKPFTLIRDVIPLNSVKSMFLEEGMFYLRITNFQETTTGDVHKELDKALKKGTINGLVLDLRNNPGGLLEQAVRISDIFLDHGVIVSTRSRRPEQDMVFEAHPGGRSKEFSFPMVVLVNSGSASAAEIVAGALQDHDRAIIIGTETFGKGSVQTVIPMPGGTGILLTTARYYTPSGDSIQEIGISPDVVVPFEQPVAQSNEKKNEWNVREKDLPRSLSNNRKEKEEDKPNRQNNDKEIQQKQKVQERLSKDNQLRTALIILKSINIAGNR
jgi:carboxyl-terminal processing protease